MNASNEDILLRIETGTEDERYILWHQLYTPKLNENSGALEQIINSDRTLLKILLARFLSIVEEEKAIRILIQLMMQNSTEIVNQAIRAFKKNPFQQKSHFLIPTLKCQNNQVLTFAIETLTLNHVLDSRDDLIDLLHHKTANNEKLLIALLTGFRFLSDKKVFNSLTPYCEDSRTLVRFHAILALGSLYEDGHNKSESYILKGLNDKSPQVRQASIWILKKRSQKKHTKILTHIIHYDSNPQVRQEALSALGQIAKPRQITLLIRHLAKETNQMVKLKGDAVLLSLNPKLIIQSLKKLINSSDLQIRNHSILLFALFQKGSSRFSVFLENELKDSKLDSYRVILIQALGITKSKNSIPLLESFLNQSQLLAYVSMTALCKIWGNDSNFPIEKYLNHDKLSNTSKQIALKHFVLVCDSYWFSEEKIRLFLGLLKHEQINMRYLSAKALSQTNQSHTRFSLFLAYLIEHDEATKNFIHQTIIGNLSSHPEEVLLLLNDCMTQNRHMKEFFELVEKINLTNLSYEKLIHQLLNSKFLSESKLIQNLTISLILKWIKNKKIAFNHLLQSCESENERFNFIKIFVNNFNSSETIETHISQELLFILLDNASTEQTHDVISMLKFLDDKKSLSRVVRWGLSKQNPEILSLIKNVLGHTLRRSA